MLFDVFDCSRNWTPATPPFKIPKTQMKRDNLQPDTMELLRRLDKEFTFYMPEPDSDQMISMIVQPVHVAMGFR
jgi:hypothetical protein